MAKDNEKGFIKAYKFEMYPDELQKRFIEAHFKAIRFLYNKTISEILPLYDEWEKARDEFRKDKRNRETDAKGKYIHPFTEDEQREYFYSFPENQGKEFKPVIKPPTTRNALGRKESPITTVAEYRNTSTDRNGRYFLKDLDSIALNDVSSRVERAFAGYENPNMGDAKKPKYRQPRGYASYSTTRNIPKDKDVYDLMVGNIKVDCENQRILLPKFDKEWSLYGEKPGWIKVVMHRDIRIEGNPCQVRSVTISRTPERKYYVSLTVLYQKNPFEDYRHTNKAAGVNFSLSDGSYIVANENKDVKHYIGVNKEKIHRIDEHINHLCEKRSRMRAASHEGDVYIPSSNNYKKMSRRINKLRARKSRMIEYMQHQITDTIVKEYDNIYVRDFGAKDYVERKQAENPDMTKDDVAYLRSKVTDMGIGNFTVKLQYKATAHNKNCYLIDKYYPCAQICSSCGEQIEDKGATRESTWTCPKCKTTHKRIENSAINILIAGKEIGDITSDEHKKNLQEAKRLKSKIEKENKNRIYEVIKSYNQAHDEPLKISKSSINSYSKVMKKDATDEEIIDFCKRLINNKKRSKIKK